LRRNETLVSVYLSNAVWPEIVSSADNDLPRFPSALLDGRCTTAVSTGLGGRTLALRLPPRDAFPLTNAVRVKDTFIDYKVAGFRDTFGKSSSGPRGRLERFLVGHLLWA
jgi:hypothetical protein